MNGHGSRYPTKKHDAVLAVIQEPTLSEAATRVGVSSSTLNRWRREPEFDRALREARRELFDRALIDLRRAGSQAVQTLVRNLDCGNPGTEIKAATTLVELLMKVAHVEDIEQRIAQLEHPDPPKINA